MSSQQIPKRRLLISLVIAALAAGIAVVIGVMIRDDQRQRRADAVTELHERRVRELLDEEPLDNILLTPHVGGVPGLLAALGIPGPAQRRGMDALQRINAIAPKQGLEKTLGPTIDACRNEPDVRSAVLILSRKVSIPDPETLLGPCSARSTGDVGKRFEDVAFYQYGDLEIGIKDGVLVAVRVR